MKQENTQEAFLHFTIWATETDFSTNLGEHQSIKDSP